MSLGARRGRLAAAGRRFRACGLAAAVLLLAGCAGQVSVRTLATGRPDQAAYELHGEDLPALQRSAQRLCPQGGEVLRQAQRGPLDDPGAHWSGRWLRGAAQAVEPVPREAYLLLLCRDGAGTGTLAAAATLPAAAASAPAADADTRMAVVGDAPAMGGGGASAAPERPAAAPVAAAGPTTAPSVSAAAPAASAAEGDARTTPPRTAGTRPTPAAPARAPGAKPAPIGPLTVDW